MSQKTTKRTRQAAAGPGGAAPGRAAQAARTAKAAGRAGAGDTAEDEAGTAGAAGSAGGSRGGSDAGSDVGSEGGVKERAGGAKGAPGAGADAPAGPPPARLTVAAAVAALEGLAVVVWGITMLAAGGQDVLAGILILALAALPLSAAYGLRRARRWSRGPALIMQLLSLPIAWTMLHSDGLVVPGGAVLGVLALLGLGVLVHPATTDALGINRTAG
ncbi:hypothetical protein [Actinacidiphila yeochonensis]|uniref:hypothetical protein n=1 Tax=Actinacidiphila yeochonensis TaxID=89050 RepID=UPI002AFFC96D|nr:hypothetical protein [Actinacidiphila yeochonensis]